MDHTRVCTLNRSLHKTVANNSQNSSAHLCQGCHAAHFSPQHLQPSDGVLDQTPSRCSPYCRQKYGGSECQAHKSDLLDLPDELLLMIVEYLDRSSTACLSLCNHVLQNKLGDKAWGTLRLSQGPNNERRDFLQRVALDNPDLFFCHNCLRLHPTALVGTPGSVVNILHTLRCVSNASFDRQVMHCFATARNGPSYRLPFTHLELVMQQHRRGGLYGIDLSALSFTEVTIWPPSFGQPWATDSDREDVHTSLLSVEPKIVADELYLRVQQWIVYDHWRQLTFENVRHVTICSHSDNLPSYTRSLLGCKLGHYETEEACPTCHPLLQCRLCSTEFQIGTTKLKDGRCALFITKWMSLGRGIAPSDDCWRHHLYWHGWTTPIPNPFQPAESKSGIRALFERQRGKSQKALTGGNALVLQKELYRSFPEGCLNSWKRPGSAPR